MVFTDVLQDPTSVMRVEPVEVPIRLTELFKIGLGPSSSHTVGPMKAAARFIADIGPDLSKVDRITATLFGSLAWTGKGHATDKAIVLGLAGNLPETTSPEHAQSVYERICAERKLPLGPNRKIDFVGGRDVMFNFDEVFDRHPNAMVFETFDTRGRMLLRSVWFSIGGGFVEKEGPAGASVEDRGPSLARFPYACADELLRVGRCEQLPIADIVMANEKCAMAEGDVLVAIDQVIDVMFACIDRGLAATGVLPGGMRVERRAKGLMERLESLRLRNDRTPADAMSYVSTFAIAVNEENAAGGRVVTAPTNGAAGVIPAVLRYYRDFCASPSRHGMRNFLLAATAIGGIIKRNASISGAEVGCQGEVGSAAAMAAAGLVAAMGGTNEQLENAAEIALEHHLGMTCDPVAGLVQIPCIERNAFGAVKAINAAALALLGGGEHRVSLDQAIETMRQTGADMSEKYRETSRGGLAVNVPEC